MKFSEEWLRQWVSPDLDAEGIAHRLTMAGLEVDSVETLAPPFSNVVVARIESAEQHPDADRLQVCQVTDGSDQWQVVCGAPNARAGLKVALARVGAVLPGDFKIKKAKLRGVESRGMLCGASELGLADEPSAGIMELPEDAPLGVDLRDYLRLDSTIIDVDITPNRGDCFSLRGIARDLGALQRLDVNEPSTQAVAATTERTFDSRVAVPEKCPRLLTRVIEGVDVNAATPQWMVERLQAGGIRSIDLVVDITNYVMLELGQPLHGYDLDRLNGFLEVRDAREGETLETLDGTTHKLRAGTLMIADGNQPLSIAGVMGGEHSGVSSTTRNVLLEAAFFAPIAMAGTARSYGLHTDSSQRFERGVDHQLQQPALERATQLLLNLGGGQPGPIHEIKSDEHLPSNAQIALSSAQVGRLLGITLADGVIADILTRLGFKLEAQATEGQWRVTAPSWRFDVSQAADLIEEVARVYGYAELPVRSPRAGLVPRPSREARLSSSALRTVLIDAGYQEAITYSFISPELQASVLPHKKGPTLANPLSVDMSVMRAGLWPGLLKALSHNLNRQQTRVRLFEIGQTFEGDSASATRHIERIAGVACGSRLPEGWSSERAALDFYDVKADVEKLLAAGHSQAQWRFEAAEHPALHPGQSARIVRTEEGKDSEAGWIGAVHPQLRASLGIKPDTYVFELDIEPLRHGRLPLFESLSRYPEVRRDLAFVVDDALPVASLIDEIRARGGEWLSDVNLFDVYQGKGVSEGHKSVALGLTWQHPSRTLNDSEIEQWVSAVVEGVSKRFDATLRG